VLKRTSAEEANVSRPVAGDDGEKRGDRISIQHRKTGLIVKEMEGGDFDLSIHWNKAMPEAVQSNPPPSPLDPPDA